ncbi:MAG: hypothetical protein AAGG75_00875 [Bacteroidota bacterium]
MKDNKDIRKELEEISPFLAKIEKRQNFEVPKDYFEQLPDEVMRRVQPEWDSAPTPSAAPSWIDQLAQRLAALLQPRYALQLASAALMIVAGFYFFNISSTENTPATGGLAALTADEVHEYISQNIDDYQTDWIPDTDMAESNLLEEEEVDAETEELDIYIDEIIDVLEDSDLEDLL